MNFKLFKAPTNKADQKEEKYFYDDKKHDGHVDSIVLWTLRCDFLFRYVAAAFIFYVVLRNYSYVHQIIISKIIDPNLITVYIKYSTIFGSALLLVLGYWFSSSGASSVLKAELQEVARRKLARLLGKKQIGEE